MNEPLTMYANALDAVGLAHPTDTGRVVKLIRSEQYQTSTEHLRMLTGAEFDTYKCRYFTAVTWGGTFSPKRKVENVIAYSGLICLDLDKLSPTEQDGLLLRLRQDNQVYVAFISPSGKGIKIIYRTDNDDPKRHKEYFNQLRASFEIRYSASVDKSGCDVSRLCFLCYDPEVYHNPDCERFVLPIQTVDGAPENALATLSTTSSSSDVFAWCLHVHSRKHDFSSGNRNSYLTGLVNFANDYGVARDVVEQECLNRFVQPDFSAKEIQATIRSIYTSKTGQHGSKEYKVGKSKKVEDTIEETGKSQLTPVAEVEKFILDRWQLRYNVVTSDVEFRDFKNGPGFLQLNENIIFRALLHGELSFSLNKLNALLASDFVNDYDPFSAYFESLPEWDGEDHIGRLASYLNLKEPERFENHFRKWLVRVVACAILPDFFNKQALVLVGEVQDSGKSSFCRFVCPPALQQYQTEFFSDDKDGNIALAENLLIILDELAALNKAEVNALKSLFSRQAVKVRHPFGRRVKRSARRASFIGSTNSMEFLNDETGSVRWLCFELNGIDWAYSKEVNMDDVYAQAYALFKSGEFDYNLTRAEIAENDTVNQKHTTVSTEQELIQDFLLPGSATEHDKFMPAKDVLIYLMEKVSPSLRINPIMVGKALKKMGFIRLQQSNGHYQVKGYYVRYRSSS